MRLDHAHRGHPETSARFVYGAPGCSGTREMAKSLACIFARQRHSGTHHGFGQLRRVRDDAVKAAQAGHVPRAVGADAGRLVEAPAVARVGVASAGADLVPEQVEYQAWSPSRLSRPRSAARSPSSAPSLAVSATTSPSSVPTVVSSDSTRVEAAARIAAMLMPFTKTVAPAAVAIAIGWAKRRRNGGGGRQRGRGGRVWRGRAWSQAT